MNESSVVFVILGMPGSGGDLLASALSNQGVFFGEEEEFEPAFNNACLSAFQMHATSCTPMPVAWREHPLSPTLRAKLRDLLSSRTRPGAWGIYQPSASLLLPLYQEVFQDLGISPRFLLCVRNPEGIETLSLKWSSRPAPPLGKAAIGAWLQYTVGVLEQAPVEVVLLDENPQSAADRILAGRPAAAAVESRAEGLIQEAYVCCQALSRGEAADARINSVIREFRHWREMLAPPGNPGTQFGLAWMERGEVQLAQTPFIPTGDWQTVRLIAAAPPNAVLSGLIYGRPSRIWMRRCVWLSKHGEERAEPKSGPGSHLTRAGELWRLDAAYESRQISFRTPIGPGPYELEIEFFLEASPQINVEAANRLANRLNQCISQRGARA